MKARSRFNLKKKILKTLKLLRKLKRTSVVGVGGYFRAINKECI